MLWTASIIHFKERPNHTLFPNVKDMCFTVYYSYVLLKRYFRVQFICYGRTPTCFSDTTKAVMRFQWLLLVAIICLAAIDVMPSRNMWKLAKANGGFAFRLYNTVTKGKSGNAFFSPFRYSSIVAKRSMPSIRCDHLPCISNISSSCRWYCRRLEM